MKRLRNLAFSFLLGLGYGAVYPDIPAAEEGVEEHEFKKELRIDVKDAPFDSVREGFRGLEEKASKLGFRLIPDTTRVKGELYLLGALVEGRITLITTIASSGERTTREKPDLSEIREGLVRLSDNFIPLEQIATQKGCSYSIDSYNIPENAEFNNRLKEMNGRLARRSRELIPLYSRNKSGEIVLVNGIRMVGGMGVKGMEYEGMEKDALWVLTGDSKYSQK